MNFSFDPIGYLDGLDPTRIGAVHLAGGCSIDARAMRPSVGISTITCTTSLTLNSAY